MGLLLNTVLRIREVGLSGLIYTNNIVVSIGTVNISRGESTAINATLFLTPSLTSNIIFLCAFILNSGDDCDSLSPLMAHSGITRKQELF